MRDRFDDIIQPLNHIIGKGAFVSKDALIEKAAEEGIDPERLPRHVAVVMDGNGRWAKQKGRPRQVGHRGGVHAAREIVRTAGELGIEVLTLFAFSTENWSRPKWEVTALMRLLIQSIRGEIAEINRSNVRILVSGQWDEMPEANQEAIKFALDETATNTGLKLNLALNYGGRREIIEATRRIAEAARAGDIIPDEIDEPLFESHLYTAGLPDPDLLIRTSGEMRISNFLLYQLAYTEIVVSPVFWPDFNRDHFIKAILDYQSRERRFGKTGDQMN